MSKLDQVVKLRDRVYEAWGEVMLFSSLFNDAATFSSWILLLSFVFFACDPAVASGSPL